MGFEAVEVFNSPAVLTVGLGLVTEEQGEGGAVAGHQVEAFGHGHGIPVTAVGRRDELFPAGEGGAQEASFDTVRAEDSKLAEGDPLDGELLLRALRLVMGDGIVDNEP